MRVLIIGGGIGGLVTAIRIRALGHEVDVFEAAPVFKPLGAGIGIQANGARLLKRWGLQRELERIGRIAEDAVWMHWRDGSEKERAHLLPPDGPFEHVTYLVHRGELTDMLAARLPPERMHVDHRFVSLQQDERGVEVTFANGVRASGDVVIGADGVHSAVRTAIGIADPVRDAGIVAYRGLVPLDEIEHRVPPGPTIWNSTPLDRDGPPVYFIFYPAGHRYLNVAAYIIDDRIEPDVFDAPADMRAAFARQIADAGDLYLEIVSKIGNAFRHRLIDSDPLPVWSSGRVALLGDAAHAMLPFLSQGANQGIEDAAVLALSLEATPHDVPGALRRYYEARRERAHHVQLGARRLRDFIAARYEDYRARANVGIENFVVHDAETVKLGG